MAGEGILHFLFATMPLPGFQSDSRQCHRPARTLQVTLSIVALLKEFHSMEIASRLQTENSFSLTPRPLSNFHGYYLLL